MDRLEHFHDTAVLIFADDGPKLDAATVNDFVSAGWSEEASWLAVPLERLGDGFLDLSTRLAGEVIQKFTNYRMGVAFIGDIAPWTEQSKSLRDFVYESDKGAAVWFVRDTAELAARLKRRLG
ncbi:MAG: DUF4180 domain-containing protein [Caulobacter sp.]|nr:DUF4180 domain-containing protein [Caulobacter sp.]